MDDLPRDNDPSQTQGSDQGSQQPEGGSPSSREEPDRSVPPPTYERLTEGYFPSRNTGGGKKEKSE